MTKDIRHASETTSSQSFNKTQREKIKPRTETSLDVFEVNVCKDKAFQPYLNVFHAMGENFAQQKLGELFGVIQIFDNSQNSAYLPNVIAQVIKKEFFSDPRRTPDKAFELALHKANLALTDLAQHEIVEWMGKINAVIGVTSKNTFHFTQAGGGRILLIRNKLITDIARGLDDGEGVGHPIKTFSNISSGRIVTDDKLIFCSETVFDSLSWEELKRHCTVFNSDEFDNIVRSTLLSEGENAGAIVINVKEKSVSLPTAALAPKTDHSQVNFFGAPEKRSPSQPAMGAETLINTDAKTSVDPVSTGTTTPAPLAPNKTAEGEEQATPDEDENISPFEKQQEIFIKEDEPVALEDDSSQEKKVSLGEKLKNNLLELKLRLTSEEGRLKRDVDEKLDSAKEDVVPKWKNFVAKVKSPFQRSIALLKNNFSKISARLTRAKESAAIKPAGSISPLPVLQRPASPVSIENLNIPSSNDEAKKNASWKKVSGQILQVLQKIILWLKDFILALANFFTQTLVPKTKTLLAKKSSPMSAPTISSATAATPSKAKFSPKSLLVVLGLAVIFGFVWFLSTKRSSKETANNTPVENNQPSIASLEQATSSANASIQISELSSLDEYVVQMVGMKDNLFILTQTKKLFRYNIADGKLDSVDVPSEVGNIKTISKMNDLNLVFLISNNSVYSYSPVVSKFEKNEIKFPESLELSAADSYLTYLYALNQTKNKILQYPRAAGGFGDSKDWLKEDAQLGNVTSMTIDGSLYLAFSDGQVKKYFRGKEDTNFKPNIATPFEPKYIFTAKEEASLYALDATNGKLAVIDKSGQVSKEVSHDIFKGAKGFWVNDANEAFLIDKEDKIEKVIF